MVLITMNIIADMSIVFPVPGNFVEHTFRWLDPSFSFAIWLALLTIAGVEGTTFAIIVRYWDTENVVPIAALIAALIAIFLITVLTVQLSPTEFFVEFKYGTSAIKVAALITMVIACFAIMGGAGP
ncbi:hypothetical protein NADFUDRAFT_47139 [Nadsonia fulvescens var. elongata DSM 6958]|uniref:Amino acid permease/ SLC12A domain-containing protein n=1 Tax=Nadsonia fulvescens var. elongata DSM 6958 TaxID=857566 RepID=A0A1E3PJW9_9ASCO|nr:hypothetical protein NADFUDRAFT_47139 [Nadsonia fulvescens var. elongata DSM 6958]